MLIDATLPIMNSLVPLFCLFILLVASVTTTVMIFSSSIQSLRLTYQGDIAKVNDNLRTVQSQQSTYAQQVQTLTKLVSESLNATDEYIHSMTDTVSETKDAIAQDVATVQDMQDDQNSLMAVQFAGMFTILVILVSGYHLSQHVRHMHSPVVQRKIMAVLWMTPIYSMSCWLSMVFVNAEPYLVVIREFYESYCVYMFLSFLIAVLGNGDRRAVVDLLEQRADQLARVDKCRCGPKACKRCWNRCCNRCGKRRRVPNDLSLSESVNGERVNDNNVRGQQTRNPNLHGSIDEQGNYISPDRSKAEAVLDQCQMYAMQFVLLRPLTAIGWLISNQLVEPSRAMDPTTPQLYITIIANGSIFFAFRGLVRFYHATRSDLEWCNPWPKFLCIKGVVFMTFWQKMVLSLVVNIGMADKFDSQEDANEFIMQAQNFLICLEMLFSAVAHCFVFSPDEWAEGYREREEARRRSATTRAFGDSVALGDFINDVRVVMASKKRRNQRKRFSKGELLPSSRRDDEEANGLHPNLCLSTGEVEMKSNNTKSEATASMDASDHLDRDFSIDSGEYVMELSTPPPIKNEQRRRLDTGGSVDSDGGEMDGSLARIEKFINDHSPKPDNDQNELV
mmetsp:Transcript_34113/g.72662  ORF Transcript_34113/g.72662 Transcript_34113/m.72662 type:complete len:621 (-) Transcript_34113:163-2025(-)